MNLQTYGTSLFVGQGYFSSVGLHFFLIFQLILNTFTTSTSITDTAVEWKSKELSNEKNKFSASSVSPKRKWYNLRIRVWFKEAV